MGKLMPITLMALAIILVYAAGAYAKGDCPYADLTRDEKFVAFDVDGNGFLSPDEFPGSSRGFARLDADGDGLISFEEWMAHPC